MIDHGWDVNRRRAFGNACDDRASLKVTKV
jgi:hypothetical protein